MHKVLNWFLLSTVLLNAGCATIHDGPPSVLADWNTALSCSFSDELMGQSTQAMTCNFENTGDTWRKLQVRSLTFTDGSQVANPQETQDFLTAYAHKKKMDMYNKNLALGGVAIVGMTAALLSRNSTVAGTGAVAATGAVGAKTWQNITDEKRKAENASAAYGSEHILSGEFSIPDGLFVRRATLVRLKEKNYRPNGVKICFVTPGDRCTDVPLAPPLYRGSQQE